MSDRQRHQKLYKLLDSKPKLDSEASTDEPTEPIELRQSDSTTSWFPAQPTFAG